MSCVHCHGNSGPHCFDAFMCRGPRLTAKDTNPKDVVAVRKAPSSTVPTGVIYEIGLGMLEGARKYGRHNYRVAGVSASVYVDAARRHIDSWYEGEDVDPDSLLSHVTKALSSLAVLRDAMMTGKLVDDRPPPLPNGWMAKANAHALRLTEKYPDAPAPYTAEGLAPAEKPKAPAPADWGPQS